MQIALTGASGFIGQHLLPRLLADKHDIVAITRDASRLSQWKDHIRIVELDLSQRHEACYRHLGQPQLLIHLAWDGLPNYGALRHFEDELPAQYRFLKQLIEEGLPSLLITGTCFEYGEYPGCLSEDLLPAPKTVYGYAKNALRQQLEFLKNEHPFNLSWARLFYMYGEGQAKNSIYSQLCLAAQNKSEFFAMSSGEQLRDYLPVEDVAEKLATLARLNQDTGVVNICSGKPVSIRTMVEAWIIENDWKIKLNRGVYPVAAYEPMAFWGSDTYYQDLTQKPESERTNTI